MVSLNGIKGKTKIMFLLLKKTNQIFSGVNIIPKKADFLDPKIIFCPQFEKKLPPVKIFFSNSTHTFAPLPAI